VGARIAAGYGHSCAILVNGSLKCWGDNSRGQLGLGDTLGRGDQPGEMGVNLPAVDLGTGRTTVAVTAGNGHTCAILDNATVKCWGGNDEGQLGVGDGAFTGSCPGDPLCADRGDEPGEMGDNLPTVDLGTGRTARAITAGQVHTCALLDDGTTKCWGSGVQIGQGDYSRRGDEPGEMGDNLPAVDLGTGRTAVAIGAGERHTCAVLDDASVKCWGFNDLGQLGRVYVDANELDMGDDLPTVDLGTGRTAVAISAGNGHTCAVLDDATVKCWGLHQVGQIGLNVLANGSFYAIGDEPGEMGDNLPAVDLGTGRTVVAISSSGLWHSCAILDDATLKCWGGNGYGELGLGDQYNRGNGQFTNQPIFINTEMGDDLPAVDLGAGRVAVEIVLGWLHSCAVLDDGTIKCWGNSEHGQLGVPAPFDIGDDPGEMGDNLAVVDLGQP
jgi:alpha-tubulin suppressor-like RCC1 family protein